MPLFHNPAVLVAFYDPHFNSGQFRLCPWQVRVQDDFAIAPRGMPKHISVVCSNGGGKSSLLMAPAAVWSAMSFDRSRTVVTSASVPQLDMQTMPAAKALAGYVNLYHKAELWDIQHRRMEFKPTHSIIEARKSDLEGTQEGFHPIVPGGEFTILVDEAKSIEEDIWKGILKWTGFTRRMDVSSAGEPAGPFFRSWTQGQQSKYRISYKDCPHITQADINAIVAEAGGIDSPTARQILLSEFAALAGSVVITLDDVERAVRLAKDGAIAHKPATENHAGLDLSGGGDETILSVWNGNKQLALETVPFHREDQIEDHLAHVLIPKWGLRMENIRADAGGLGRPMIRNIMQKIRAKGKDSTAMRMIMNQQAPLGLLKANFGNRGTEMWFKFANLVRECSILMLDDQQQITQLANRYYRQKLDSDKVILEPKAEARAKGHPSPDRCDASVLAMYDWKEEKKAEVVPTHKMSGDELTAFFDDLNNRRFAQPKHVGSVTMEHLVGVKEKGPW